MLSEEGALGSIDAGVCIPEGLRGKLVIPLWPDAGQAIGLAKNATYAAARRGEIPTVRLGVKLLVPVVPFLQVFGIEAGRDLGNDGPAQHEAA